MTEHVKLIVEGETYHLPVVEGSEGEKAIDINDLRNSVGPERST